MTTVPSTYCKNYSVCPLAGKIVKPEYGLKQILLIGEAPGEIETLTGKPFTGRTGKILRSLLNKVYLTSPTITNAVLCRPPNNRTPTQNELELCKPNWKALIEELDTKLVICVGKTALHTVTDMNSSILSVRGEFFSHSNLTIFPTIHPSFIVRDNWEYKYVLEADLIKSKKYLSNFVYEEPNTERIYSTKELEDVLYADRNLAFDLETTSFFPWQGGKIKAISFSDGYESWSLVAPSREQWSIIQEWLEYPSIGKITQNGTFDILWLSAVDIKTKGLVWDTKIGAHLLHSSLPANLEFLRGLYTDYAPYKSVRDDLDSLSDDKLAAYNATDSLVTYRVYEKEKAVMPAAKINLMSSLLLPISNVIVSLEEKGVLLDIEKLYKRREQYSTIAMQLHSTLWKELECNPNSPIAVKKALAHRGLVLKDTKKLTVKIRARGVVLEDTPEQIGIMKTLYAYRMVSKAIDMMTTFTEQVYESRLHTDYLLEGTATGRLASRNPNLQNVPPYLKQLVIPDEEEYCFFETDYSQLELRVALLLMEQYDVLEKLDTGYDPHSELAAEIYGCELGKETHLQRVRTKNIVFGVLYGRSDYSIAKAFGVPLVVAQRYYNITNSYYPKAKEYHKKVLNNPSITTPFGRTRVVGKDTELFNFFIQSTASDVTLKALLKLYETGLDIRLTVHDSIIAQIHREDIDKIDLIVKEITSLPTEELGGYRFASKTKYGSNWAFTDKDEDVDVLREDAWT